MSLNERSLVSIPEALPLPGGRWGGVLHQDVVTRLRRQHPNILLIGPAAFALEALNSIEPAVPQPIVSWRPSETPEVPSGSFRTLVIHRVDTADAEQQQKLCAWFDARPHHVQVVSTALAPLYPFVEQGTFLETLYYRLNHVCLVAERLQD